MRKFFDWLFATTPEPTETPPGGDAYLADLPTALHRVGELKFRYMHCGHHVYEWCAVKGQCLQCVLEGRQATKDRGWQRPGK
jgi:hypothetical protein